MNRKEETSCLSKAVTRTIKGLNNLCETTDVELYDLKTFVHIYDIGYLFDAERDGIINRRWRNEVEVARFLEALRGKQDWLMDVWLMDVREIINLENFLRSPIDIAEPLEKRSTLEALKWFLDEPQPAITPAIDREFAELIDRRWRTARETQKFNKGELFTLLPSHWWWSPDRALIQSKHRGQ